MNILFRRNKKALVVFMAPLVIIFMLIIIIPLGHAFVMSFTEWDGVNEPVFTGIKNYKKLFASPDLGISLKNSMIFSVFLTTYQLGMGLVFAFILVNCKIKGKRFFKDAFFLPQVLSVSVVAQLWISIYHGDFGLINQLASALGTGWRQQWLSEPVKGIIAIVAAESWKGMGYHMLILYAAMHNVPKVYYEASTIDGATPWQQFKNITLPLIAPTLKACFIMAFTFGFRAFEQIFIMTKGGPGNYTYTLSIMLYKSLFGMQKYGYANTVAMLIVAICVTIMLIVEKITKNMQVEY